MKYLIDKKTGMFLLKEDLVSGIKAAASNVVDVRKIEDEKKKEQDRKAEQAKEKDLKDKEASKKQFEDAKNRILNTKIFKDTFNSDEFKKTYPDVVKTIDFIYGTSGEKPTKEELTKFTDLISKQTPNQKTKKLPFYYKKNNQKPNVINLLNQYIKDLNTVFGYNPPTEPTTVTTPTTTPAIPSSSVTTTTTITKSFDDLKEEAQSVKEELQLLYLELKKRKYKDLSNLKDNYDNYNYYIKTHIDNDDDENLQKAIDYGKDMISYHKNQYNKTRNKLKFWQGKLKESKLIKEYREEINNLLIPNMQQQLKFDRPPTINFLEDEENAKDMFGKTAHYNPNTSEITVYVTGRHPKDIMRSVAHEVVHHAQNCRGEFDRSFEVGEGYAQSDEHLRNMEKEAYLSGNMLFRDWEDNFKKQRNATNMINENALRAIIRKLIAEEMQDASSVKNEPVRKHEQSCECEECQQSKKDSLKMKGIHTQGYMAESVRKAELESMPLNEWRRTELNSLLMSKFGFVAPHAILGEKKNKKPDADGDGVPDWADKKPNDPKVGAKETKPKSKKGKIPPQFLKGKKKDESK